MAAATGCPFQRLTGQSKEEKAREKIPGAGGMIQYKIPGRKRQRAQPALSIAPAQGEGVDVSHQAEAESTARAKSQRRQKNGGNYPGRGVGRIQKSWTAKGAGTPAHRRARGNVGGVPGKILITRLFGRKTKEAKDRAICPEQGVWPNAKSMAATGIGHRLPLGLPLIFALSKLRFFPII